MRSRVKAVEENGGAYRARTILAAFLMLGTALLLASCAGAQEPVEQEPVEQEPVEKEAQQPAETMPVTEKQGAAGQQGVTISEIVEEPDDFYGQTVTVQGVIAEVLGPNLFVIVDQQVLQEEEDELFDDPETLAERGVLVANPVGDDPNLAENQSVRVAGTVRPFDVEQFSEEGFIVEIEPEETFNFFRERAAIVADSIQVQPGGENTQMQETTMMGQ